MLPITYAEVRNFKSNDPEFEQGYVVLQENGELRLVARYRSSGQPVDEFNLIEIGYELSLRGSIKATRAFLNSDKVRELFETLHDGHSVEFNGSNYRGQLTEEARSAYFKLYSVFADFAYRVA